MKNDLGAKIKSIRRELGLTQEELANPMMTKGMISHIEKGISYPSMKNLRHIAKKLDKPLAFFVEDNYVSNIISSDLLVEEVLEKLRIVDKAIKENDYTASANIVDNILKNNKISTESKLYADIMFRKAQILLKLNDYDRGEEAVNCAYDIYIKLHLYFEAARIYLRLIEKPYSIYDYEECLSIYVKAKSIYKKASNFGEIVEIEMDTYMIGVYTRFGDMQAAKECCARIINICKYNNIYYNIDTAFKYGAMVSLVECDIKGLAYNIKKAIQFYELCENNTAYTMTLLKLALYKNEIGKPNEALMHLNEYKQKSSVFHFDYYLEEAKAYYKLGLYDTALESIKRIKYDIEANNVINNIYIWSGKIYEGIIHLNMRNSNMAIYNIGLAIEKLVDFSNHKDKLYSIYAKQLLNFACECMGEVYSSINDYKNAFKYISMANGMNKIS